jgi:microcin C transport system permease protein
MRDYVLRRLLLIPLTFVGITFVAFCFTRFVPGGPIEQAMAARQQADQKRGAGQARPTGPASPEELDNLRRRYGFDKPLVEAYAIWLGVWPGAGAWQTGRLDPQGTATVEVEAGPATAEAAPVTRKLKVTRASDRLAVTDEAGLAVPDWRAEAAPLPDDPDKAPRFVLYRPSFSGLLQLDLGESTESNKPVWAEIKARLPLSIWFGGWSLLLAYAVSIPLGVAKALKRDGAFDRSSTLTLFILYSIPSYVLAVVLLKYLGYELHWFPTKGFAWDGLSWGARFHHTLLPLGCMTVGAFTVHALRNSLIPIAATFGHNLGFFLTGSFLIEVTFNLPGMGLLGYDALLHRNFPVFLGLLTLSSLAMLLGNIVSDLCVAAVDPRIRFDKKA